MYTDYFIPGQQNTHSSAHRLFTKKDHILSHEGRRNKFKVTEVMQFLLLVHNRVKLVINNRKTAEKSPNTWRLSTLINSTWIKRKLKRNKNTKIKENKTNLWMQLKLLLGGKFSALNAYNGRKER